MTAATLIDTRGRAPGSRRPKPFLLRRRRDPLYAAWIADLADRGSWERWSDTPLGDDPLMFDERLPDGLKPYRAQLASLRRADAQADAVVCGTAMIGGNPVVLILSDFSFLAGTMGVAAGRRLADAFGKALELDVPVVAVVSSAGARMQEGPLALLQMVQAGAAAAEFRRRGRGYFVCFSSPSMGGVLASWAGLGTMSFGLPGALLGVTGPRVVSLTTGKKSAATVPETAEEWLRRGLLDDVATLEQLRLRLSTLLNVLAETAGPVEDANHDSCAKDPEFPSAWDAVCTTRNRAYPAARWLIDAIVSDATSIVGDRTGGDDPSLRCLIGRVCGHAAVVIAQERWTDGRRARVTVEGYRKARRAIAIASELRLPIVTMIDTPGPDDSGQPRATALAYEIAATTQALLAANVPTLAVLVGEGGGGAAVAFLAADRVIAAVDAWLAPIAPEAASAILLGAASSAPELARAQRISAADLLSLGIVDDVVSATACTTTARAHWRRVVSRELETARAHPPALRSKQRLGRCAAVVGTDDK